MSYYVVSDLSGYQLAHAGETHEAIEEDIRHREQVEDTSSQSETENEEPSQAEVVSTVSDDSGFEPPIVHSSFTTSMLLIGAVIAVYVILKKFGVSFLVRYLAGLTTLIILSAIYVLSAPEVTAIAVGFGFVVALIVSFASMNA